MSAKNPYKRGGMFEGASPIIFANAKHLRRNMTDAEILLWMDLKNGISGLKFRRQHPIGLYIADFYCHKAKLIIEIDGSIHNDPSIKKMDEQREKDLKYLGYKIIRFTNQQVLNNLEKVVESIIKEITAIINSQKLNASPESEV